MKFIWWVALIIAIVGVLMHLGILSIREYHGMVYVSAFWAEVVSVGLFAFAAIFKDKALTWPIRTAKAKPETSGK